VRVLLLSPRPWWGEGLGEGKLNKSLLQIFSFCFLKILKEQGIENLILIPLTQPSPPLGERA